MHFMYNTKIVVSVCPSVRTEQLCSHWTDFNEILYFKSFFFKSAEKIQVSLKSDNNNGHLTWRPMHIYISLNSF